MSEHALHTNVVLGLFGAAVVTFFVVTFISAPYGRHRRDGWGPTVPSRLGWLIMEAPSVLVFGAAFATGAHAKNPVPLVLAFLWMLHYFNRGVIYPFRARLAGKRMPVLIVLLATCFTSVNGWANARWISHIEHYGSDWLTTGTFGFGVLLFVIGWAINMTSDETLLRLRKPGESGYKIPHGGMFRWVSCPNYLGEIVIWIGWAIVLAAPVGWAFALYTIANLAPRARTHHSWYRETFPDYPPNRRALVPYLF